MTSMRMLFRKKQEKGEGSMGYFMKATPEEVGIHSEGILKFLETVEKEKLELHSLMVIRHGKCCGAGWWSPYGPEYIHTLFSFSKSFTSTAIGFAEQEGLLSLDEKIVDIFPEYVPENPSENLLKANLHHLLTMSCGHETEIHSKSEEWIKDFIHHPFLYEPGTFYQYNSAGTNMLAAVLRKKTGQNVTEYLRPRLLDPLGIDRIPCALLGDGTELGGGGMKTVTENMAKFAYFVLHRGKWEGKQLLRENWFDRACTKQIETAGDAEGHVEDWAQGYGYQYWMNSYPGSFRADGAFGQFGFVFPDLDMIVVTTAATKRTQSIVDAVLQCLVPAAEKDELPASTMADVLEEQLGKLTLAPMAGKRYPETEKKISEKVYTADDSSEEVCSSMETLIGGVALFDMHLGTTDKMSFVFSENAVTWKVWEKEEEKQITAALDEKFYINVREGVFYGASAGWMDENTLLMEIRRLDTVSGARITFRFEGDKITFDSRDTLIAEDDEFWGAGKKHTVPFYRK